MLSVGMNGNVAPVGVVAEAARNNDIGNQPEIQTVFNQARESLISTIEQQSSELRELREIVGRLSAEREQSRSFNIEAMTEVFRRELAPLTQRTDALEAENIELRAKNRELETRVVTLEEKVATKVDQSHFDDHWHGHVWDVDLQGNVDYGHNGAVEFYVVVPSNFRNGIPGKRTFGPYKTSSNVYLPPS